MLLNTVTIIQARTGSSRFPNKVLFPLCGKPLLIRMVERVNASKFAGSIVVATTTDVHDDIIEEICFKERISCFRGHPTDLLDRHFKAGLTYDAEIIVKIPSDCPLIDPKVIDRVISFFHVNQDKFDFVSNLHPPTYPDGQDVEVMSMDCLRIANELAMKVFEREHTTPFLWDNPDEFRIGNVAWETGLDYSMTQRWTIDYEDDYKFIATVYNELFPKNRLFGIQEILALLDRRPDIKEINEKYTGVNWYRHNLNELKTIKPDQTKIFTE